MENKQNLLTIVVPIYQPKKDISAILKNLTKQKNQNFDVIILIDKPNDNELEAIKKYKQNIGNRLKLIINSSHQHISIVLRQAFAFVKTEYSYIFYSYSYIKSEFTNHIINFINKSINKPDFIELNGYCRGLVHYDFYRDKFQNEKIINLELDKSPITLISPYSFNFLTKTEIYKKIYVENITKTDNLEFSASCKYKSIILSKTFAYYKNTWVEDYNFDISILSPKIINLEWENIWGLFNQLYNNNNEELKEALLFSQKMHLQHFEAGMLGQINIKNKKSLKLIKTNALLLINKFNEKNPHIINKNKYFLNNKIVILNDVDIQQISKWEKIFKNFTW